MGEKVLWKDSEILQYSGKEIVFALAAVASERNLAYACWRLPGSEELCILVDFSETVTFKKPQLEKSAQGFIIQSFLPHQNAETIFLNPDVFFSSSEKEIIVSSGFSDLLQRDSFFKEVEKKLVASDRRISLPAYTGMAGTTQQNTVAHYTDLVNEAKKAIRENRFKKIVLARSKQIALEKEVDLAGMFDKAAQEYSNALISLVYTKTTGTWFTATPEILASIDQNGLFRTIALAGTQLLKEGDSIQKAVWTQKEIEEQALVGRYIINCFKKIRLREYDEEGPRTVQSGNLLHLRTDYTVDTSEHNFPELATVMLELLHPTSAVCGMPKEVTLEFIKEHENLERKLFSGYLGPVNIHSESHIFVNLRCANLWEDRAILYAGAGITQDSEPEKELRETEMKMEAVGRFFTGH